MISSWLKLLALRGLSIRRKRALINHFGSAEVVFGCTHTELRPLLADKSQAIRQIQAYQAKKNSADIEMNIQLMDTLDIKFIPFNAPTFPPLLNQISDPPLGLFIRGKVELLLTPQLAIVGSRNPSPAGLANARAFATELAQIGLTINSGLALGIDTAAHLGALEVGQNTIAVMATGADQIYPATNQALGNKIAHTGLLTTEFPPATSPRRQYFPQRNRLISGLTLGTLVIEAGTRSGSLITARLATEQGREVFAIPGSIHLPTSRGCHYLIRQGAKLVETIEDILDEIGHYFQQKKSLVSHPPAQQSIDIDSSKLLKLVGHGPTSMDQIISESGLTAERVCAILMTLELAGRIIAMPGGAFQRLP